MGSDKWIALTVAPACGFYLPPGLSSAACDAVQKRCVIPDTKLPKLHAWKMTKMLPRHLEERHCLVCLKAWGQGAPLMV